MSSEVTTQMPSSIGRMGTGRPKTGLGIRSLGRPMKSAAAAPYQSLEHPQRLPEPLGEHVIGELLDHPLP
jgi:hypothetical protein